MAHLFQVARHTMVNLILLLFIFRLCTTATEWSMVHEDAMESYRRCISDTGASLPNVTPENKHEDEHVYRKRVSAPFMLEF